MYQRIAALPSETVGGDLLVVDVERDLFFSANPIGAFIWSRLVNPASLNELVDAVVEKFEGASRDAVEADVREFLDALEAQQIVRSVKDVQSQG